MRRYDRRFWPLAVCLSALAGYVDAVGFLQIGGLFVSFMSGNTTRLAVGLVERPAVAALAAGLIGCFVAGVFVASLIAAATGPGRRVAVLLMAGLLLLCAAALFAIGDDTLPALLLASAMGAANCVFQRGSEVTFGVTYMTGTLVKLGQHLAHAARGQDRRGWVPYLLLWGGLVSGAVCGASVFSLVGAGALWFAAGAMAALAVYASRLGPAQP